MAFIRRRNFRRARGSRPAVMARNLNWLESARGAESGFHDDDFRLGARTQGAAVWWDWGVPAFLVWVALELQEHFERHVAFDSVRRLFVTLGIAAGVFLGFTCDRDSRWTSNLTTEYLTPENPDLAGWLPESGGIIYNSDMDVFTRPFIKIQPRRGVTFWALNRD